jgi:hypothetical protein
VGFALLIVDFKALLAPNAQDDFSFILTELASKMRDYLGKQAGNAATRQTTIQNQVYTNYVNNDSKGKINADMNTVDGAEPLTGRIVGLYPPKVYGQDPLVEIIAAFVNGTMLLQAMRALN